MTDDKTKRSCPPPGGADPGSAVNPGLQHSPKHNNMEPYSCYFTCRCNRTRAEHESQQTQRYPAAEDPQKRVLQEGLPGREGLGKPRGG